MVAYLSGIFVIYFIYALADCLLIHLFMHTDLRFRDRVSIDQAIYLFFFIFYLIFY